MARHNHKRKHVDNKVDRRVQAADPSYDRNSKTYAVTPPETAIIKMPNHHQMEPCIKIDKGRH